MYKKKSLFITFEGVEGSGKSYQTKKLFKKIKKLGFKTILTREPGGTKSAEKIRDVILDDYFHSDSKEKFDKYPFISLIDPSCAICDETYNFFVSKAI